MLRILCTEIANAVVSKRGFKLHGAPHGDHQIHRVHMRLDGGTGNVE